MTQDEIIETAEQAGMVVVNDKFSLLPFLEAFAKLVAERERQRIKEEQQRCYEARGKENAV